MAFGRGSISLGPYAGSFRVSRSHDAGAARGDDGDRRELSAIDLPSVPVRRRNLFEARRIGDGDDQFVDRRADRAARAGRESRPGGAARSRQNPGVLCVAGGAGDARQPAVAALRPALRAGPPGSGRHPPALEIGAARLVDVSVQHERAGISLPPGLGRVRPARPCRTSTGTGPRSSRSACTCPAGSNDHNTTSRKSTAATSSAGSSR